MTFISDALPGAQPTQDEAEGSFETLFHEHYDRVYGLLFRLVGNRGDAEDLTQEVFLKLHDQRFAPGREHNVSAWLYRVATNAGYNAIRGRRRRWQRNTVLLPDPTDQLPDPVASAGQREIQAQVRAVLAQMPRRDVQLLLMRQMDFNYAEIAAACSVAPGSVGTLLRRAAARFRRDYEEKGYDPAG